ncbi:hypothetical protein K437DRAFT_293493 [Tilletiaria anomala UBC 951]|uniref:GRAM domain-containing protein n=1 Tax=Tilletiaria anomala (strain ATCC 24038 / CBS 436.72 / UBC 951) TaxID=1037660 RepID=A0A066WL73_TILAU|nr:uncharacterized protein K437DRAFT_293493 [Tilletiaria anomala UBC 951]KDN51350.1 hypothetical protein K437DRAFT_293493 [Tilletiaria anomala UBC 951]
MTLTKPSAGLSFDPRPVDVVVVVDDERRKGTSASARLLSAFLNRLTPPGAHSSSHKALAQPAPSTSLQHHDAARKRSADTVHAPSRRNSHDAKHPCSAAAQRLPPKRSAIAKYALDPTGDFASFLAKAKQRDAAANEAKKKYKPGNNERQSTTGATLSRLIVRKGSAELPRAGTPIKHAGAAAAAPPAAAAPGRHPEAAHAFAFSFPSPQTQTQALPESPPLLLHHGPSPLEAMKIVPGAMPVRANRLPRGPAERLHRVMMPAPCGDVSDSDYDEDDDALHAFGEAASSGSRRSSLSSEEESVIVDAGELDLHRVLSDAVSARFQRDAAGPNTIPQCPEVPKDIGAHSRHPQAWHGAAAASALALASKRDADRASAHSLASGKANHSLNRPLLELEEIELKHFLRNFSKHTRQMHVPAATRNPQRRMPRWSDFRVAPDEAAQAARDGRRISVLTHVDQGLRAMREEQHAAVAEPRAALPAMSVSAFKDAKKKHRDGERDRGRDTDTDTDTDTDRGKMDSSSSGAVGGVLRSSAIEGALAGAGAVAVEAAGGEKSALLRSRRSSGRVDISSTTSERDARRFKDGDGILQRDPSGGRIDVHASNVELKPAGAEEEDGEPERGLLGDEWTLLEAANLDEEVAVDSYGDEEVDGVAFTIAYILAFIERYAPGELDDAPEAAYSESRTRSHIARLYLIAPFWERLLRDTRELYRWDNPRRTAIAAMIYFCLWYTDMLPTSFLLYMIFCICRFRFFPPEVSVIAEKVKERFKRGAEAERINERLRQRSRLDIFNLYRRWIDTFGIPTQVALGDIADGHEKIKSLILWRNPTATWRTIAQLSILTLFVTFAPPQMVLKAFFFCIGVLFFILLPLQSHYPRYRRPLSPIWWALWGCPTDAQFAIKLLRRRHLQEEEDQTSASRLKNAVYASGLFNEPAQIESIDGTSHIPFAAAIDLPIAEEIAAFHDESSNSKKKRTSNKPRKLGSFFCQNRGVPGFLHVTTEGIYFVGVHSRVGPGHSRRACKTPFTEITHLIKTNSMKLFVWSSSGLQIKRADGKSYFFANMNHRDKAFNLILALGPEVWSKS